MRTRNMFLWAALVVVVVAGMACGGPRSYQLEGTREGSGADGTISVARQDGGNYLVTVNMTNLLPPARVRPTMTTYVVWFQPVNQAPQRVGVLAYDEARRSGGMSATTASASFHIVVSAEDSSDVAAPSGDVVFRGSVEAPPE